MFGRPEVSQQNRSSIYSIHQSDLVVVVNVTAAWKLRNPSLCVYFVLFSEHVSILASNPTDLTLSLEFIPLFTGLDLLYNRF